MADTAHKHEHQAHTSPWPFTAAMGLMLAVFGVLPLINEAIAGWILVPIGTYLFLLGIIAWLVELAKEQRDENLGKRLPLAKSGSISLWATWLVIFSELFLFGALFACYFYLKNLDFELTQSRLNFFVADGELMQTFGPLVIANTILLVSSSVTLQVGESMLKKGKMQLFRILLGATIVLGLVFVSFQVLEYAELVHHGFTVEDGPHGTLFYMITGLHGIHVSAGALLLLWVFIGSFKGQTGEKSHRAITVLGIYWHFVDVVWIFLVFVLYLRVV